MPFHLLSFNSLIVISVIWRSKYQLPLATILLFYIVQMVTVTGLAYFWNIYHHREFPHIKGVSCFCFYITLSMLDN